MCQRKACEGDNRSGERNTDGTRAVWRNHQPVRGAAEPPSIQNNLGGGIFVGNTVEKLGKKNLSISLRTHSEVSLVFQVFLQTAAQRKGNTGPGPGFTFTGAQEHLEKLKIGEQIREVKVQMRNDRQTH